MSILQQTFTTDHKEHHNDFSLTNRARTLAAKLSESFWFCLSFLLFIIMGPFSAIAVLIGLCSLASSKECRDNMVEPASI